MIRRNLLDIAVQMVMISFSLSMNSAHTVASSGKSVNSKERVSLMLWVSAFIVLSRKPVFLSHLNHIQYILFVLVPISVYKLLKVYRFYFKSIFFKQIIITVINIQLCQRVLFERFWAVGGKIMYLLIGLIYVSVFCSRDFERLVADDVFSYWTNLYD